MTRLAATRPGGGVLILAPSEKHPGGIGLFGSDLAETLSKTLAVTCLRINRIVPRAFYPFSQSGPPQETADPSGGNSGLKTREIDLFRLRDWIYLARLLRAVEFSHAIILWWTAAISLPILAAVVLCKLRDVAIVLDVHELIGPSEERNPILRFAGLKVLNLVESSCTCVCHSPDVEEKLVEHSNRGVVLIPHPLFERYPVIDQGTARSLLDVRTPFLILAFGTIRRYKRREIAIEALENLPEELRSQITFAIVGGTWGDESEAVLKRARNSPAHCCIRIRESYVSTKEAGTWFSAANILVQPYLKHSQSGVSRIGMSHGLDIIISESGDAIQSSRLYAGMHLVKPGDPGMLATKLSEILDLQPRRHSYPEGLTWRVLAAAYLRLLQKTGQEPRLRQWRRKVRSVEVIEAAESPPRNGRA